MALVFRSALLAFAIAAPCSALGVRVSAHFDQGRYHRAYGALLVIDLPMARWLSPDEPRVVRLSPFDESQDPAVWLDDLPRHEWDRDEGQLRTRLASVGVLGDALNDDGQGVILNQQTLRAIEGFGPESTESTEALGTVGSGVGAEREWGLGGALNRPWALPGSLREGPEPAPAPAPNDPASEGSTAGGTTEGDEKGPGQPAAQKEVAPRPPVWQLSSGFVIALVRAALRDSERGAKRLDDLQDRSRTAAWLPQLRARAGRNTDETLRLTPTSDDPNRWQLTGGADLRLELQLAWELDRLVFASEELHVERSRLMVEQRRQRRVERVLELIFDWQSATLRGSDPWLDPEQALLARLRAEQAARALDWYTGGWFGRNLPAEQARHRKPARTKRAGSR